MEKTALSLNFSVTDRFGIFWRRLGILGRNNSYCCPVQLMKRFANIAANGAHKAQFVVKCKGDSLVW